MWSTLLACLAFADPPPPAEVPALPPGMILVEAHVPAEVRIDRRPVAQVYLPSTIEFAAPQGDHELSVLIGGATTQLAISVPPAPDRAMVLIGRTGTTVRTAAKPAAVEVALVPVEVRGAGPGTVQFRIDSERYQLENGATHALSLPTGEHPISVRSPDGTAIWAVGKLKLSSGDVVIVQVSEGRLPEVSGAGVFVANGG